MQWDAGRRRPTRGHPLAVHGQPLTSSCQVQSLPCVSASVEPVGGIGVEFLHTSAVVQRDVVSMLELLQKASCNVLAHCAPTLFAALTLSSYLLLSVLLSVLQLYPHCAPTSSLLCSHSLLTVLSLSPHYAPTLSSLCSNFILTVLQLSPHCAPTLSSL